MAKRNSRRRTSPRGVGRSRRRGMTSWRRSYSTSARTRFTSKHTGKRRNTAVTQNLNIRDVQKTEGEEHEYRVYLSIENNWSRLDKLDQELTSWIKSCISGRYKIYRIRQGKFSAISSIKLESESDLMMFMLCHREHVRKIFRMVDEPAKGSFATNND